MIFIYETAEELQKNVKTKRIARLITQCDSYMDTELPETPPPMSTTFMGAAIGNLALCYLVIGEKKYFDECRRWIRAVISYKNWGYIKLVNVDLSASWIMFGLCLAYDWLKNDFLPEEKKALEDKLLLQCGILYDYFLHKSVSDKNNGWAVYYFQNHNWINMCALGAAGIALKNVTPNATDWLAASLKNFDTVFSLLPEDGSDYEGVPYWRYGAAWLYYTAHLFKTERLRDYFRDSPFLQNSFMYRVSQAVPNLAEIATFGDCHDTRSSHNAALYYLIAAEYNNGHAQYLGNLVLNDFFADEVAKSGVKPGIKPEAYMEYLFYDNSVEPRPLDDLPLAYFSDDMGVCSVRSGWERDATYFAFKSSYPGGKKQWNYVMDRYKKDTSVLFSLTHQHPDNNAFILHAKGEYLVIDDGFNRTKHASDHSVILVDGKGYPVEGSLDLLRDSVFKTEREGFDPQSYTAEITRFDDYGSVRVMAGEAARVYDKSLKLNKNERVCILINGNIIFIIDNLVSELPHNYTWQIHTEKVGSVQKNAHEFRNNDSFFMLYPLHTGTQVSNRQNRVRAVMTPQEPTIFHECVSEVHMDTTSEPVQNFQFRHLFTVNHHLEFAYENNAVHFSNTKTYYIMRFKSDADYNFDGSFLLTATCFGSTKVYTDSMFFSATLNEKTTGGKA